MPAPPPSVEFVVQYPHGTTQLFKRLVTLLETDGLKRFRVAVAYARWEGLGLIAPQLEAFLRDGGEFQSIYGVANGVTTPDSLMYSLYLQELYKRHTYAGAIEDKYANSIFHPKFFEFRFSNRTALIIGSANLTGGGLLRNTELSVEIETSHGAPLEKEIEAAWKSIRAGSQQLTLGLVRKLKAQSELASERDRGENQGRGGKPRLPVSVKASPKPLFAKILGLPSPKTRSKILAKMDPLSVRPRRLYLQVLSSETGGQGGHLGYQIQLPVATLASFFGVGANQTRKATFRFPNQSVTVNLTHFGNNTHRVRLRPVRDVPRPAVLIFTRLKEDEYACSVVPPQGYAKVLSTKCKEQTRTGARRWGLE